MSSGSGRSRTLRKKARGLGWEFRGYTGSGHMKFYHPVTHQILFSAATSSDMRAERNALARLRKMAVTPNPHKEKRRS